MARLKDGRIGRFGWKAQEAGLEDFVLTACAVELGLHVPGRPQAGSPLDPEYRAPGEDLNSEEVAALVAYIGNLPRPVAIDPGSEPERELLADGRLYFESAGCAACHTPHLGGVEGIYSDLLLHDMGPDLGDQGSYGAFAPDLTDAEETNERLPVLSHQRTRQKTTIEVEKPARIRASRLEWRTPPLWGLRDSAPYLHDGRGADVDQAIALHGGEAERSAEMYFALEGEEREALKSFLRSLAAPP